MSAEAGGGLGAGSVRVSGTRHIWDPTNSLQGSDGQALKLSQYEPRTGIKEERIKEEIAGLKAERHMRYVMVIAVTVLFMALNGVVVWMITDAAGTDRQLIAAGTLNSEGRLITEKVYMSLVGATVVQVSSILIVIARYLFPSSKDVSDDG